MGNLIYKTNKICTKLLLLLLFSPPAVPKTKTNTRTMVRLKDMEKMVQVSNINNMETEAITPSRTGITDNTVSSPMKSIIK